MATRYWVGGAGTWDATTTTNWSATSGGGGGASAPTSVDNVIFDTLSNATAYAVTVGTNANAADITIAGPAAGNVTITWSATSVINCYGSWTNAATGVVLSTSSGCNTNFLATTTGKTFTTNSVTFGTGSNINFNGVGGGWTLGSALTTLGAIKVNAGTFNTGSYSITASFINSSNTAVRSINLGSSTITLSSGSPWVFTTTTNLTFNANTSTIVCSSGATITFAGSGLTYYNVSFTSAAGSATIITGTNTFNNLNQTSPTSSRRVLSLEANQIISGTLTLGAANAYNARIFVQSDTAGTSRTLTVATIATLADVDFRDVTAAGASAPWSGTRLGNGLGNTSITFVAGKTVYWNLVAGGNWSANAWATSSGGAVATANFPLAQDTVIIDNTGLTAGNTITMDSPWFMGTLNVTRTNAWTLALSTGPVIYGDFTIPSVTTVTGASAITFQGQGLTQTLTTNGVSLSTPITVTSVGGTVLLNGAVTCAATATVTLTAGTLNLNGYTLSTGLFSSTNSNTRTLAFGTGKIVTTGTNVTIFNIGTSTGMTVSGTNPLVEATGVGTPGQTRAVAMGRFFSTPEAYSISLTVNAGADLISFTGGGAAFRNVSFVGFTGTFTILQAQVVYGNWNFGGVTGMTGTASFTFAATSGTKTITSNSATFSNAINFDGVGGTWQLQDAMLAPSTSTTTLTNGTLNLNGYTLTTGIFSSSNSNTRVLAFGSNETIYLSGVNTTVYNTSNSTGFTVTYINPNDNYVTLNASVSPGETRSILTGLTSSGGTASNSNNFSIWSGDDTVSFGTSPSVFRSVVFYGPSSEFSGSLAANAAPQIYGEFFLLSGTMTVVGGTNAWSFLASNTITLLGNANRTINNPITINTNSSYGVNVIDALTLGSTRALTLISGTLRLYQGTTNTVGSLVTTGTTQKFLKSTSPGTQATISAASGTNSVSYLTIQDSYATGGAAWDANASTNVNAGNNFGWFFAPTPADSNEITMRLRSFTQPRRF